MQTGQQSTANVLSDDIVHIYLRTFEKKALLVTVPKTVAFQ